MKEDLLSSEEYLLWVLIAQTRNIITRARDNLIDRKLIPSVQGAALYYISTDSRGVTISALAHYLFRNNNSVSELLIRMEKKGWIKRIKDVAENHRIRIVLTEKGKEACYQATRPDFIHEIMSALTLEQRQQLQSLVEVLRGKALSSFITEVPFPPHLHK
jgi:DNA-binding MarR family transcriptional regulator